MGIEEQSLAKKNEEGRHSTEWQKQKFVENYKKILSRGKFENIFRNVLFSRTVLNSSRIELRPRRRVERVSLVLVGTLVKSFSSRSNWPTEERNRFRYWPRSPRSDSIAAEETEDCAAARWKRISSTVIDEFATQDIKRHYPRPHV